MNNNYKQDYLLKKKFFKLSDSKGLIVVGPVHFFACIGGFYYAGLCFAMLVVRKLFRK